MLDQDELNILEGITEWMALNSEGVSDPINVGVVGSSTRYLRRVKKGCKVLERMVLKRLLGEVQRLENATKKQSSEWLLRN